MFNMLRKIIFLAVRILLRSSPSFPKNHSIELLVLDTSGTKLWEPIADQGLAKRGDQNGKGERRKYFYSGNMRTSIFQTSQGNEVNETSPIGGKFQGMGLHEETVSNLIEKIHWQLSWEMCLAWAPLAQGFLARIHPLWKRNKVSPSGILAQS